MSALVALSIRDYRRPDAHHWTQRQLLTASPEV